MNLGPMEFEWQDSWNADNSNSVQIRGHALCFREGPGPGAFDFRPCSGLLSDEAWARTLALAVPAAPGSAKRAAREELLRREALGEFDQVHVYVPDFVHMGFPAISDEAGGWRAALAQQLRERQDRLSQEKRRRLERCLAMASPPIATREDIEAEYIHSGTHLAFLVFPSAEAAERLCLLIDEVLTGRGPGRASA